MTEIEKKKRWSTGRIITNILLAIFIIVLLVGLNFQKKQETVVLPGTSEQYYKIVSLPIPDTLSFCGEPVSLDIFYVRESLDQELTVNTYWHSATLQLIKRSARWFPLIDSILKSNRIPADFKYIAAIESGLQNVVSPAGATGFWQFLKDTGKEYGLEIDDDIDERYHVEKSTEAACKYLQKSYDKYKDWNLVAASYNAGMNGISKLLDEQGAESYYDLLTSQETSRYVFRALAIKLILEDPESYGFYVQKNELYLPIPVHYIEVNQRVGSWVDFAKENGISYKLLKYFNPWLRDKSLKNRKNKTYLVAIPNQPFNLTHESWLNMKEQRK
jgi:hypothetical protein